MYRYQQSNEDDKCVSVIGYVSIQENMRDPVLRCENYITIQDTGTEIEGVFLHWAVLIYGAMARSCDCNNESLFAI